MTCWEWVIIIIVLGLVSTVEAVVITGATLALRRERQKDG